MLLSPKSTKSFLYKTVIPLWVSLCPKMVGNKPYFLEILGHFLASSGECNSFYASQNERTVSNHVPFLMYLNALVLKLCNFDMLTYHRIYVVWVFLTIFPLFSTVVYFTRSRVASLLSCVFFCTFTELVQWDAHFFAIRQASLPFFACFIYCFFVRKKAKLSHISYHSHNLGEGKKHLLISFRSKRNNACTIFRPSSC